MATPQVFSFTVDRHKDKAVSMFAVCVKNYVNKQQELGPDPYLSPKILPLEGTVPQTPLLDDLPSNDGVALLSIADGDDSSDDDGTAGGPSTVRMYWKPRRGDISMFTKDLLELLADLTGCFFFRNRGAKQIGISGINSEQALSKLHNLEKLQVSILLLQQY